MDRKILLEEAQSLGLTGSFEIKQEPDDTEFNVEDLHHSIDIKEESPFLEPEEIKCECYLCGIQFYDKSQLIKHSETECLEKQFSCEICAFRCLTKIELNRHRKTHIVMEPVKHIRYKACMVPNCKNTTTKTPGKLFLSVPKDAEVRKKWCIAMNSDKSKMTLSPLFCCEEHFTLKDDLDNYWQHKLLGNVKRLRLRIGVIPHKFHCQEEANEEEASEEEEETSEEEEETSEEEEASEEEKANEEEASPKGKASDKPRTLEENVEQTNSDPKPGFSAISFVADDATEVTVGGNLSGIVRKQWNKSIQVAPNYRSKGVSKKPDQKTVSVSTLIKTVTTDSSTSSPLQVKTSFKRKLDVSSEEESSSE